MMNHNIMNLNSLIIVLCFPSPLKNIYIIYYLLINIYLIYLGYLLFYLCLFLSF